MREIILVAAAGQQDAVRLLSAQGYGVALAETAPLIRDYLLTHTPDLIILDGDLPEAGGICRSFRERSDHPVVLLQKNGGPEARISGLKLGADYCLPRTVCPEELAAVVNRLLDRVRNEKVLLRKGALAVDRLRGTVTLNGENVHLTAKEFGLLLTLMQNEGKEITVEELYEAVWKAAPGRDMRTIRKHIMNLRAKIRAGETDDYDIVTSYGKGYVFQ